MQFDLKKNAKNFINESIHCAKRADNSPKKYPFAILHLIQGLELTLKYLLSKENKMLVYENIDIPNFTKTVSVNKAIYRLINFKIIELEDKDIQRLERTINFRNQITHYEFVLNKFQAKDYYVQLFEFLHYFYTKYVKIDLHDLILKEHWEYEAKLIAQIKRSEEIHYNGTTLHREHPAVIIKYQKYDGVRIDGVIYNRIKWGDETTFKLWESNICGDCGVKKGYFHTDSCDHEQCPKCGEQLIGFHKCEVTAYVKIPK